VNFLSSLSSRSRRDMVWWGTVARTGGSKPHYEMQTNWLLAKEFVFLLDWHITVLRNWFRVIERRSTEIGVMMAKKNTVRREWTATEIHKLRGLAKKKVGVDKIARTLKRTVAATAVKASALGVSLDTRA
jgi:hypothetical protein